MVFQKGQDYCMKKVYQSCIGGLHFKIFFSSQVFYDSELYVMYFDFNPLFAQGLYCQIKITAKQLTSTHYQYSNSRLFLNGFMHIGICKQAAMITVLSTPFSHCARDSVLKIHEMAPKVEIININQNH